MLLVAAAYGCGDDDNKTGMMGSPSTTVDGGAGGDGGTVSGGGGTADLPMLPVDKTLPIIFVHGFAGSASQFESQAIRFAANGYPRERIRAFDHNGEGFDVSGFISGVDEYVNNAIRDFGVQKVILVGHSRGTLVSSTYMMDPARAAKIAKYVSLDGSGCGTADAAGIPCLAPSQQNQPGEKHVEVATSPVSFEKMFQFFVGMPPTVTKIVKQNTPVQVSGRVVNFPANTGRAGTTLSFYEINADTGARIAAQPVGTFQIGADGNFGPQTVDPDKHYELALTSSETGAQHFYPQRFLRSSHLMRLLSGGSDSPARMNTNVSDRHAALTVLRMREWTGDDILEVQETSKAGNVPVTNVITQGVAMPPTANMGPMVLPIGLYLFDDMATPGMSSLQPLPYFSMQPFQGGVDVFLPATDPPDGTITLTNYPRGDRTKPQVLNVANWPSLNHFIQPIFCDYPQE